mmetsp:Transcript_20502/g.32973  ORF Transcript_20502/g.32973 Transcript_20502/m.32973 type:complete len:175 (-) Transcript_20502:60-584(-)
MPLKRYFDGLRKTMEIEGVSLTTDEAGTHRSSASDSSSTNRQRGHSFCESSSNVNKFSASSSINRHDRLWRSNDSYFSVDKAPTRPRRRDSNEDMNTILLKLYEDSASAVGLHPSAASRIDSRISMNKNTENDSGQALERQASCDSIDAIVMKTYDTLEDCYLQPTDSNTHGHP